VSRPDRRYRPRTKVGISHRLSRLLVVHGIPDRSMGKEDKLVCPTDKQAVPKSIVFRDTVE